MDDSYDLQERPPTPETYLALREAAGMTPRDPDGAARGLDNSLYAVVVVHEPSETTIGMGRVVGDGGTVFHICDMVVHPDHQRQGIGTAIMGAMLAYLDDAAPPDSYVNLMADIDGFYEQFGFEETRPASKGMYKRT